MLYTDICPDPDIRSQLGLEQLDGTRLPLNDSLICYRRANVDINAYKLGTNGMGQRATQAGSASPYSAISQAGSLGKQFKPYGTGMGFNGGLGGGMNVSSVGGNYGKAAGTNAASFT